MIRTLQVGDEWLSEREGGLARYYYELLRHLPAERLSARGLVVGSDKVEIETLGKVRAFAKADDPMKTRVLGLRGMALPLLKAGSVDLLACHFALYGLPLLDRLQSAPTVVHFHGPWAAESGAEGQGGLQERMKAAIEGLVYRRASRLIVLSEAFRQELIRRYRIPAERVRIVPGGVDTQRFHMEVGRREAREQLGWPVDRPVMVAVRRHVRRMGLEELIDAVGGVKGRHPDVLLMLGGTGPISGELRQRISEKGLEQSVRLLGRVPDEQLPLVYRAADLSVVPTQMLEGFGLITLESLASGTPVLVTPVGGLPETLMPFAPQCVFPDKTAEAMANTLDEVLRGARTLPSEADCRAYAIGNFAWETIAAKVVDVYEEALR